MVTVVLYFMIGVIVIVGGIVALWEAGAIDVYISEVPGFTIVACCFLLSMIVCWPLILIAVITILIASH